jgi:hypothetical protein
MVASNEAVVSKNMYSTNTSPNLIFIDPGITVLIESRLISLPSMTWQLSFGRVGSGVYCMNVVDKVNEFAVQLNLLCVFG